MKRKMIVPGRQFALIFLLVSFAIVYYTIRKAQKGRVPKIRPFPAIEAIPEAVGRCAEMGRPIFAAPGMGEIETAWAAETISGLNVVHYTARHAAKAGVDVISIVVRTPHIPLTQDAIRTAYLIEGTPERYRDDMVRFVPYGMAYDVTIMGVAERERPAASVIVGTYWHPALYTIEAMNAVGAMNIGGTSRTVMTPFFIGGCDYFLMGEEVLAAGAYVSPDPVPKGSFEGQDIIKIVAGILIIVGAIAVTFGSRIIENILRW
jgi:hypothetical protein